MEDDDDLMLRTFIEMEAEEKGIECDEDYILREIERMKRPFIIEREGRYSLSLKENGEPIKNIWYDEIKRTENNLTDIKYFSFSIHGKVGIMDANMDIVVDCILDKYDSYELLFSKEEDYFSDDFDSQYIYILKSILVHKDGLYGIIRRDGSNVTPLIFNSVITRESHAAWMHQILYDDIIAVLYINKDTENQKIGFIVQTADTVNIPDGYIKPIYDSWTQQCVLFDDSHLEVIFDGKSGYLDAYGNFTESISKGSIGMSQYWAKYHGFK